MPIQKKVALLGASGVGKTSLVRRFVESLFDETYLTTIGVKVDKKIVSAAGTDVQMMLWDVAGAEEHFSVPMSYVRGAAGFLLVVDGTRPETLDRALDLAAEVQRVFGPLPHVVVLNKIDLVDQWRVEDAALAPVHEAGHAVIRASARTGEGVDEAFLALALALLREGSSQK